METPVYDESRARGGFEGGGLRREPRTRRGFCTKVQGLKASAFGDTAFSREKAVGKNAKGAGFYHRRGIAIPASLRSRQSRRFLEISSLHPPPAALR